MKVRLAKLSDISDILAVAKRLLPQTNYAPFEFNGVIARRTVQRAMTSADSRVWVSVDEEGRVKGFLIGEIGAMPFTHRMSATDLAFMAEAGGDLLVDAFKEWCILRKCARIDMGISAGPDREAAVKRAFRRKGFTHSGGMFHIHLGETT